MKPILSLICLTWICLSASLLQAQQGIASKYAADVGIANDPEVVFSQDFETGSLSQILALWNQAANSQGMSLISSVPPGSKGTRALEITSVGGQNTGGHLYKTLSQGYEQLYLRYYIYYRPGGTYHHTGAYMGGFNPPTTYPQGGAGIRPTGHDSFSSDAEPVDSNLRFDFYTYWMGMGCLSDPGGCWGNTFIQDPSVVARTDRWICVEIMIKVNSPRNSSNGELALWIDGQQITHLGPGYPSIRMLFGVWTPDPAAPPFPGFQWSIDPNLSLNWIWLQHYTTGDPSGYVGRIWLDHIVLAKSYIGPISAGDSTPPAPPTGLRVTSASGFPNEGRRAYSDRGHASRGRSCQDLIKLKSYG